MECVIIKISQCLGPCDNITLLCIPCEGCYAMQRVQSTCGKARGCVL